MSDLDAYWKSIATLDDLREAYRQAEEEARGRQQAEKDLLAKQHDADIQKATQVGANVRQTLESARRLLVPLGLVDYLPRSVRPVTTSATTQPPTAQLAAALADLRTATDRLSQHREDARLRRRAEADQRERVILEQRRRQADLERRQAEARKAGVVWDEKGRRGLMIATVLASLLVLIGAILAIVASPVAALVAAVGVGVWWPVRRVAGPTGPRPEIPKS